MKEKISILIIILAAGYFFHAGQEKVVYKTPTGHRYHYDIKCPGLTKAKTIIKTTKQQASLQGYTLCKIERRGGEK